MISAITLFALATVSPTQFNLECAGTLQSSSILGEKTSAYATVYRIDLAVGKWCEDQCKVLFGLESVQPTQLTLQDAQTDTLSEKSTLTNFINRETGDHVVLSSYSNPRDRRQTITMRWSGQCKRADFSGFPSFETKF